MVEQVEAFKTELQASRLAKELPPMPWQVPVLVNSKVHISGTWPWALTWTGVRQTTQNKAVVGEGIRVEGSQPLVGEARCGSHVRAGAKLSRSRDSPRISGTPCGRSAVWVGVSEVVHPANDSQVRTGRNINNRAGLPISGNRPQEAVFPLQRGK